MEPQPRPELETEQAAKRARPGNAFDLGKVLADGASGSGVKEGEYGDEHSDDDDADGGTGSGKGAEESKEPGPLQ